jgi:hypothetical protein
MPTSSVILRPNNIPADAMPVVDSEFDNFLAAANFTTVMHAGGKFEGCGCRGR